MQELFRILLKLKTFRYYCHHPMSTTPSPPPELRGKPLHLFPGVVLFSFLVSNVFDKRLLHSLFHFLSWLMISTAILSFFLYFSSPAGRGHRHFSSSSLSIPTTRALVILLYLLWLPLSTVGTQSNTVIPSPLPSSYHTHEPPRSNYDSLAWWESL